jgi:hypothetical protein
VPSSFSCKNIEGVKIPELFEFGKIHETSKYEKGVFPPPRN